MKLIHRKLKININDERFSLVALFCGAIAMVLALTKLGSCFWGHLYCSNVTVFFSAMMQVDITCIAVSVAVLALFYSRNKKESYGEHHWRIIHESNSSIIVFGIVSVAINGICIIYENRYLYHLAISLDFAFLFLFVISIVVIMSKNWKRTVLENVEKQRQYVQVVLSFKKMYRQLCYYLDTQYNDTESYYSQVERIQGISKQDVKFLKSLPDLIDKTHIGSRIKNLEHIISELASIESRLGIFDSLETE